jgi:hypothetical protein
MLESDWQKVKALAEHAGCVSVDEVIRRLVRTAPAPAAKRTASKRKRVLIEHHRREAGRARDSVGERC